MNPSVLVEDSSFIVTFFASFLIWFMMGGLVFLWVVDGRVKREQALHAFLSGFIAYGISVMIKNLFPTERPFGLNHQAPLTIIIPSLYSSFPSIHSAVAFGIATSVWIHNKRLGVRFLILAALVALGRVLSDVHYIHDVIGGMIIGVLVSYLIKRLHLFKLV